MSEGFRLLLDVLPSRLLELAEMSNEYIKWSGVGRGMEE